MLPDLLPPPQRLRLSGKSTGLSRLKKSIGPTGRPEPESYRLVVGRFGATLVAPTPQGLFYGGQTWKQLQKQYGPRMPCLELTDWPDYPVRGFYHDISRGKVPTLKTLLELAEKCAHYKLNHLELYIEHTYAFRRHPQVWQGSDPLTAKEIRILDARCADLHIDLVPSFSTFGHFYTWIHHKFPELNELEQDVSGDPFCWRDRMAHYTLDCQNPRSLALVEEIIAEVRPLFRSKFFNICADETFDLGTGRNKALAEKVGKNRLYIDFLHKIMAAVKRAGAMPLFWGDIVRHCPGMESELPGDAVLLDWDYSPNLSSTKLSRRRPTHPFYVCPSVIGYNRWLPDYRQAHRNITRFARLGKKIGAAGLLNTDWGDCGHLQTLGPTWPGIILGAAAAWNSGSDKLRENTFAAAISRQLMGDRTGRILGVLTEITSAAQAMWEPLCWMLQPRSRLDPDSLFDPSSALPTWMLEKPVRVHVAALKKIQRLRKKAGGLLPRCRPDDPRLIGEIRLGLMGLEVMEKIYLFYRLRGSKARRLSVPPRATAQEVRKLEQSLAMAWRKRNKPSEYFRIREVLRSIERDLQSTP